MRRIVIRHIRGSKAEQVEEFPADEFKILTLGRNPDQTIRFDPDKDDLVSRQHARISWEAGQEEQFFITDVGSSHGTYVNKQRISGSASILPGDEIQLGPGGPAFQFDLHPRPDGMIRPTRELTEVRETREAATSSVLPTPPAKTALGRATVERLLGQYQQSSRKTVINLAAALIGVIIIVAGSLIYMNLRTTQRMGGKIDEITAKMISVKTAATSADPIMEPAAIVNKFGPATVFIEVSWKLIDTKSNRQVYHQYIKRNPAYIRVTNGANEIVLPWLSLEDENNTNKPIGGQGHGSGFAVIDKGFILSARHVVAPWHTRYQVPDEPSVVFDVDRRTGQVQYNQNTIPLLGEKLQELRSQVYPQVPADITVLVKKQKSGQYEVMLNNRFEGRYESLNVTFPNDKLHMPARLVRMSDQHDVALIKVEAPYPLPKVDLYDSYNESRPGHKILVLGYPAVSPDTIVRTKSYDPFNPAYRGQKIRDVTVTDGLIGKVIHGEAKPRGGDAYDYYSEIGDVLQLTINATGAGNSGGPVFDDRGRVIGIFAYMASMKDTSITFAVPIRFGMEIMRIKPVFD